jgi:hypothetical protein
MTEQAPSSETSGLGADMASHASGEASGGVDEARGRGRRRRRRLSSSLLPSQEHGKLDVSVEVSSSLSSSLEMRGRRSRRRGLSAKKKNSERAREGGRDCGSSNERGDRRVRRRGLGLWEIEGDVKEMSCWVS